MEEKKEQKKTNQLWQNLKDAMFFTRKPGCPYCPDLQLDKDGKPLVTHPTARQNEE